jgi:dUTP pyrophosphatase
MSIPKMFLFTDDEELRNVYKQKSLAHNEKVLSIRFADSGFDLLAPYEFEMEQREKKPFMLNYHVKCAMYKDDEPQAYYLYARSSIYKTGLRMANSVGIIDRGYRGDICAVFDLLDGVKNIEKHQRINQICHPNLEPFLVEVVDSLDKLGNTERGEGGFGSTGK